MKGECSGKAACAPSTPGRPNTLLWLALIPAVALMGVGCTGEEPTQTAPAPPQAEIRYQSAPPPRYQSYGPSVGPYEPYAAQPAYPYEPGYYPGESYPSPKRYPRESYPSPDYYARDSYPESGYSERWPDRAEDRRGRESRGSDYWSGPDPWESQWRPRDEERRASRRERYWGPRERQYGYREGPAGDTYPSRPRPYYEPETKPGFPSGGETFNSWGYQEERPWGRVAPSRRGRGKPQPDTSRESYWGTPRPLGEPIPYPPYTAPPSVGDPYAYPGGFGYPGSSYPPAAGGYPADDFRY